MEKMCMNTMMMMCMERMMCEMNCMNMMMDTNAGNGHGNEYGSNDV